MAPNNEALQLPPPMEQPPAGESSAEAGGQTAEKAAAPESKGQAPASPPTSIPLPTAPVMPASQQSGTATSPSDTPAQADDGDLIEKEWVNKAKQIVEKTRDDPYKQSEELTVFKADYMKKRYDKSIKVNK